eukprot:5780091-Heterocapsa_arctica.AAC.1
MAVVVMQKDVPTQWTCMKPKGERQLTKGDIPVECGSKPCITCNARDKDKQMMNPDSNIHKSTVLEQFVEMKGDA